MRLPRPARLRLLGFVAVLLPALAQSAQAQSGTIDVTGAWSRAALAGRTGVMYVTVTDKGAPDRLIGVETPVAEHAELHESFSDNGVMKMRPVSAIPIAPGAPAVLRPGGYHVMLMGLRQPLKEGDSFPATLRFANAGTVPVTVRVAKAGAAAMPAGMTMEPATGGMAH